MKFFCFFFFDLLFFAQALVIFECITSFVAVHPLSCSLLSTWWEFFGGEDFRV